MDVSEWGGGTLPFPPIPPVIGPLVMSSWLIQQAHPFLPAPGGGPAAGLVETGLPTIGDMIRDLVDGMLIPSGSPEQPRLPGGTPGIGPLVGGLLLDWYLRNPLFFPSDPQRWGVPNSRPAPDPAAIAPDLGPWPKGQFDPFGANVFWWRAVGRRFTWENHDGDPWEDYREAVASTGKVAWMRITSSPGIENRPQWNDGFIYNGAGTMGSGGGLQGFLRSANLLLDSSEITSGVRPQVPSPTVQPFPDAPTAYPDGWAPPATFPATPAADPLIRPLPQPRPATTPALPGTRPLTLPTTPQTEPARSPSSVPATAPTIPPIPGPAPGGGTTLTPGGVVPDPARPPVPTTPPRRKVVGPVGKPIVVDPVPVPDTLKGIAEELGRVETKLAVILRRPEPEGFDLEGLLDKIRELLNGGPDPIPGATYQVRPPCGRGPGGAPLPPVEVPVPEAADATGAILARLDALAVLIDEQKQLRQPVCKGKPVGEPVTVTFEQVG